MNFLILSRQQAEDYSPELGTAIISITGSRGESPASLKPGYLATLRLVFDDITPAMGEAARTIYCLFKPRHALKIRRFLETLPGDTTMLVVHCGAGISRSAAVALAAAKFLEDEQAQLSIGANPRYQPNWHVFQVLDRELTRGLAQVPGK